MRLLLASDHFPPFIGGAHRWAMVLALGLASRGHDVTVATVWSPGLPRLELLGDDDQVPVHRVRQLRTAVPALARSGQHHAPPFADPLTTRDLRRVVNTARPEAVLSHGWLSHSVAVALRGTEIPLALSAHDYGYFCATRNLLYRGAPCSGPSPLKCVTCSGQFYGKAKGYTAAAGVALSLPLTARRSSALQSVTSFVDGMNGRFVVDKVGGRDSIRRFTIPAFLDRDPPGSSEDEAILARLPSEPFILFVGALRPLKGVDVLVDAYHRLIDPPPLVLMGTIERDSPELPSDALVLTNVPHAAVMRAWDRALIGVVPSVWPEPLATVSVEGISRGVPMIGTVPSGMVDVLGDGAGILVASGDAAALAEAMRSLIDDPSLRAQLGQRGRDRYAEFEPDLVLTRYEEMLAQLVSSADGGAPA